MKFRDEFESSKRASRPTSRRCSPRSSSTSRLRHRTPPQARLRLRFLPVYTGGAVDVVSVVNRSGTAVDSPEFRDLLSQYEVAMDNQLKSWEEEGKKMEMKGDTANVFASQQKAMEDMGKVSKQIRDLNREYGNRVMAMMNEEQKGKFEAAFNGVPIRVYKKVFVQDQLDAAAKLKVDTTQKETVSMLRDQWAKGSQAHECGVCTGCCCRGGRVQQYVGSMIEAVQGA